MAASFIDERFGQLDQTGRGAGSSAFKAFIAQQTAERTAPITVPANGHPQAIRKVDKARFLRGSRLCLLAQFSDGASHIGTLFGNIYLWYASVPLSKDSEKVLVTIFVGSPGTFERRSNEQPNRNHRERVGHSRT
jgi:hypothetical protein